MIECDVVRAAASPYLLASLLAGASQLSCSSKVCHLSTCGSLCTDLETDPDNCGTCGSACGDEQTCNAGKCTGGMPGSACTAPEVSCGDVCVNLSSSPGNCGACGSACHAFGECNSGACANPLVVMRTDATTGSADGRDLFVLDDVTLTRVQLDTASTALGGVVDQATLPDGRVVFVGAEDTAGVFELFLASPLGGALAKLSGPLVAGGNVQPGVVVAGTTIIYRADADVAGQIELFAVNADTGTVVKVNAALPTGANVSPVVAISADATKVAYVADQDTAGLEEAFLVDLAGSGAPTKLNATVVNGVWDLAMSADASTVAYRNDDASTNAPQLFVVETANPGAAIHVDNALQPTYTALDFYTFSGTNLFYAGAENTLQASLWETATGSATVASQQIVAGSSLTSVQNIFQVSADGKTVYYRQTESGPTSTKQLFAQSVAGGSAVALSPTAIEVADFALSPDQSHIAFRVGADGAEGGSVNRGTNGPFLDNSLAPAIDELDLTGSAAVIELGSDANDGIAAGYVVLDDGRCVFMGDLDVPAQQDAFLASGTTDSSIDVGPPLGSAAGANATDVVALSPF
jgi:Tol biopolymer transport system component